MQAGMTEFLMLFKGAHSNPWMCVSFMPALTFHSASPQLLFSICLFAVHCDCASLELVLCEDEWHEGVLHHCVIGGCFPEGRYC